MTSNTTSPLTPGTIGTGAATTGAIGTGAGITTSTTGSSALGGSGPITDVAGTSAASEQRETNNLIASDKVEGTPVRRSSGDTLGTIERVMIDKRSGKVAYAVMSFGGFLGMGEDHRSLPWDVLKYNTELDAYEVNLSDDQLRGAPSSSSGKDASYDREWEEHVHRYYNATPYWGV